LGRTSIWRPRFPAPIQHNHQGFEKPPGIHTQGLGRFVPVGFGIRIVKIAMKSKRDAGFFKKRYGPSRRRCPLLKAHRRE